MISIAERVANGVEYMDSYGPKDWRSRINLDTLDISNERSCVFGQVFGCWEDHDCEGEFCLSGWTVHLDSFYENVEWEEYVQDYGFGANVDEVFALTQEWKKVLS